MNRYFLVGWVGQLNSLVQFSLAYFHFPLAKVLERDNGLMPPVPNDGLMALVPDQNKFILDIEFTYN